MKRQLVAILLLASLYGNAQEIFQLKDPGSSFLLLDKGWTYRMVDSPMISNVESNNSGWKTFQPAADIHDDIPEDARTGIGWMRLYINVSKEIRGKQLAMMIRQSVASEVYLNGQKIRQYGIISEVPAEIKAHDPRWEPFILNFSTDSIQFLAIRFAVQPGIRYAKYYGITNPFISARVMRIDSAQKTYRGIYMRPWLDLFMCGIIFMAFILHFAFFLMNPEQKANLYFALAALIGCISSTFHNYYYFAAQVDQKYISAVLTSIFSTVTFILMLLSILSFLKKRKSGLLWLLAVMLIVGLILAAQWYANGIKILVPIQIFSYLIIVAYSYRAKKNHVPGAGILIIGFSIAVLSFFIFLSGVTSTVDDHLMNPLFNPWVFFYLLYVLGPPTSLSIFLANDFARTSKRLQQKLDEVELLSEKNIAVEKEKQEILSSQNQQLELKVQERTAELNLSLTQVKETQAQLVQAEKMASLGELTAGIAHEIQNPLNFVNNFSEVSAELIAEMKSELNKGRIEEAIEIADDIDANLEKVNHHGKRADSIVKGMLQHSRTSSGQKEPTDINALADEYLRIAYHGTRAKDKAFNATLKTDFDDSIGKVNVIPQDIGRVLLNLFNNAFYAVAEKKKLHVGEYEPVVTVNTQKTGNNIFITVSDNGIGIPQKALDKIFQPFFTTKPTGQGTGLGLSLSYDIIQVHGGGLSVETKEGDGATFVIQLPVI
jgi:two-component system, NtrC family, sensor kinase